jgi:hypothetical protein
VSERLPRYCLSDGLGAIPWERIGLEVTEATVQGGVLLWNCRGYEAFIIDKEYPRLRHFRGRRMSLWLRLIDLGEILHMNHFKAAIYLLFLAIVFLLPAIFCYWIGFNLGFLGFLAITIILLLGICGIYIEKKVVEFWKNE